jgi:hypothetical protein
MTSVSEDLERKIAAEQTQSGDISYDVFELHGGIIANLFVQHQSMALPQEEVETPAAHPLPSSAEQPNP